MPNSANRAPEQVNFCLVMQNSTSTMYLNGTMLRGDQGGATTGIGGVGDDAILINGPIASAGTFSQDTTTAWAVRVTWQNGTADVNVDYQRHYAIATLY